MNRQEAFQAAQQFVANQHVLARMEKRSSGGYRAVFDLRISKGSKKFAVTKQLIAQWHITIPTELWAALPAKGEKQQLSQEQADQIRSLVTLPKDWAWPHKWFVGGVVCVVKNKYQTVTSHCVEP